MMRQGKGYWEGIRIRQVQTIPDSEFTLLIKLWGPQLTSSIGIKKTFLAAKTAGWTCSVELLSKLYLWVFLSFSVWFQSSLRKCYHFLKSKPTPMSVITSLIKILLVVNGESAPEKKFVKEDYHLINIDLIKMTLSIWITGTSSTNWLATRNGK